MVAARAERMLQQREKPQSMKALAGDLALCSPSSFALWFRTHTLAHPQFLSDSESEPSHAYSFG